MSSAQEIIKEIINELTSFSGSEQIFASSEIRERLQEQLIAVDDDILINCIGMKRLSLLLYLLQIKYDEEVQLIQLESQNECMIRIGKCNVANLSYLAAELHFVEIVEGQAVLEGIYQIPTMLADKCAFVVKNEDEGAIRIIAGQEACFDEYLGNLCYEVRRTFKYVIPLRERNRLRCFLRYEGKDYALGRLNCLRFFPVAQNLKNQYAFLKQWVLQIVNNNELLINRCTDLSLYEREFRASFALSEQEKQSIVQIRDYYLNHQNQNRRRIWLFFDRLDVAGDNGEALFRYATSLNRQDVDCIFIISGESPDFVRLQQYGHVVRAFSNEHKRLLLCAEYIFASQINGWVENPYGKYEEYFRDVYHRAKVVFLQHGVTKDDHSKWLNRFNQNLYAIVSSSKYETQAYMEYPYYYPVSHIWGTGMPRNDRLICKTEKMLVFMPTWRQSLMHQSYDESQNTMRWVLNENASTSLYFETYRRLFRSPKLLRLCKWYHYRIVVKIHPLLQPYVEMFDIPSGIEVAELETSYNELFGAGKILVTDYSSVAFDFAFLRKSLIYYQFDSEDFFKGHTYTRGYFDYQTMGFGPVVVNQSKLLREIKRAILRNGGLTSEYRQRCDDFFKDYDTNCCSRILELAEQERDAREFELNTYSFDIVEGHIFRIRYVEADHTERYWHIYLENVFWGGVISFPIPVPATMKKRVVYQYLLSDSEYKTTGEYREKGESTGSVYVFTREKDDEAYFVMYRNSNEFEHFSNGFDDL